MGQTKELFQETMVKIRQLANDVEDGNVNPLEAYHELYFFKKEIEPINELLAEAAINEAQKYSKPELQEMGVQFAGGGYAYKYDHIPEWVKKKDELKTIEDAAKNAFILENKPDAGMIVKDSGEVIIPAKGTPKKQGISFKK